MIWTTGLICWVLCVVFCTSYVLHPTPWVLCPTSCIWCPASYILCPAYYILRPTSYIHSSCFPCPMSHCLMSYIILICHIYYGLCLKSYILDPVSSKLSKWMSIITSLVDWGWVGAFWNKATLGILDFDKELRYIALLYERKPQSICKCSTLLRLYHSRLNKLQ